MPLASLAWAFLAAAEAHDSAEDLFSALAQHWLPSQAQRAADLWLLADLPPMLCRHGPPGAAPEV